MFVCYYMNIEDYNKMLNESILSLLLISFLYLEKYNKQISINHLLSNRKAATNREVNVDNANL